MPGEIPGWHPNKKQTKHYNSPNQTVTLHLPAGLGARICIPPDELVEAFVRGKSLLRLTAPATDKAGEDGWMESGKGECGEFIES